MYCVTVFELTGWEGQIIKKKEQARVRKRKRKEGKCAVKLFRGSES